MFGAILEKFRIFTVQINYLQCPNFSLSTAVVGIISFFSVTKSLLHYQSICLKS